VYRHLLQTFSIPNKTRPRSVMTVEFRSAARIVNDMTTDAIDKQSSALGKVIHADIKVTGIDDVPQSGVSTSSEGKLLEPSSSGPEDDEDKQRADHMRIWWDEAIAKNMSLPEGYLSVSVLIIKWADELDELKTKAEVSDLLQRLDVMLTRR
jgi:hypothetical protein